MAKIVEQKYTIGTIINTTTGKYIIEKYYKKNYMENDIARTRNVYECRCLKDGYIFERTNNEISKHVGCPVCNNKIIIYGINSLADVRPDLVKYFVDNDIPKKIAPVSNTYQNCKCPYCSYTKPMNISNLYKSGFSCPICSDGISYPNKYVREFLNQLNIEYIPEMVFDWGKQYLYDEYIQSYNMIIENDGEQHSKENAFGANRNDKAIDIAKEQLALANGIMHFIRIDCGVSNGEYIKNSIMNSILPTIFLFKESDVNWLACEEKANGSLVREVWSMWNDGISAYDIMNKTKLSDTTIRDYINKGYQAGICNKRCYFKKEKWNIKGNNNNHMFTIKPIHCIEEDAYYISSSEYARIHFEDNICYKSVSRAAKYNITYKGKHFHFISKQDFNNMKSLSVNDPNIKVYGEMIALKYIKKENEIV